jgi:hypothetical protein
MENFVSERAEGLARELSEIANNLTRLRKSGVKVDHESVLYVFREKYIEFAAALGDVSVAEVERRVWGENVSFAGDVDLIGEWEEEADVSGFCFEEDLVR